MPVPSGCMRACARARALSLSHTHTLSLSHTHTHTITRWQAHWRCPYRQGGVTNRQASFRRSAFFSSKISSSRVCNITHICNRSHICNIIHISTMNVRTYMYTCIHISIHTCIQMYILYLHTCMNTYMRTECLLTSYLNTHIYM